MGDEWVSADGERFEWVYLDSPLSVVILAVTPADELVLIRQFRPTLNRRVLELPGGLVGAGEQPAQTAQRELLEETGYALDKNGRLAPLGPFYCLPAETNRVIHYYVAHNVAPMREPTLDDDIEDVLDLRVELMPVKHAIAQIGTDIDGVESCFGLMLLESRRLAGTLDPRLPSVEEWS